MQSQSKPQEAFFIDELILKFIWQCKEPWITKAVLKKKNQAGGLTLAGFKACLVATLIRMVWAEQGIDRDISGTEQRAQKQAGTSTDD